MVSTSDFGSENIGSSPVPPTGFFYHINNILWHIPLLVKVGVFFFKTIMIDVKDIISRLQKAKIDNKQEPAIVSVSYPPLKGINL